jgi:hypothetical protein
MRVPNQAGFHRFALRTTYAVRSMLGSVSAVDVVASIPVVSPEVHPMSSQGDAVPQQGLDPMKVDLSALVVNLHAESRSRNSFLLLYIHKAPWSSGRSPADALFASSCD